MSEAPVLVLGATGTTGRGVTDWLRKAGHPVRPASRSSEVGFDWGAPSTWEPGTSGVRGLYLMASDGVAVGPAFVTLAVECGTAALTGPSGGLAGSTRTSTKAASAPR